MAFSCLGLLIVTAVTLYYKRENARRDAAEGGRPAPDAHVDCREHFDKSVGCKHFRKLDILQYTDLSLRTVRYTL